MRNTPSEQQAILLETSAAREKAELLLDVLLQTKDEAERRLRDQQRTDAMKVVTGRSSLDNAIATTRRLIQLLNQRVEEVSVNGTNGDVDILDAHPECEAVLAGVGVVTNGHAERLIR
jgi:F0F1-type ATP synthase epsilon subunit